MNELESTARLELAVTDMAHAVSQGDATGAAEAAAVARGLLGSWLQQRASTTTSAESLPRLLALRATTGCLAHAVDQLGRLTNASLLDLLHSVEDPGYAEPARVIHPARPLGANQWQA
jgi:hypothetical protein